MKCLTCNQDIIVHDSLIPSKVSKPITYNDKITKGMIYTLDGLVKFSRKNICEVCKDSNNE